MSESIRVVRLPEDLCAAVEKKFGQQFSSLEELLTFLLREFVSDETTKFDEAEQRMVEERLRELGYI